MRIALALALTPWVDANVMARFKKHDDDDGGDKADSETMGHS